MPATPRTLTEPERLDWLRLIRSENVGPVTFNQLLRRYGSASAALEALPELARHGGRSRGLKVFPRAAAERELEAVRAAGAELVAIGEPAYPAPLAAIYDPPPLLAVKGHMHLLKRPAFAIVGTRNASAAGVRFTERIAAELGARGLVIVSGLARGIDAAAHRGALGSGTAAVFAGGIDVVYPTENEALAADIAETGVILAESATGIQPQARHFPRRNRLISGLALGLLVVEAAPRSGSLITARMALEQGREVFAVPGSPLDPRSRGPNGLIRQGATLTENAEDVMAALEGVMRRPLEERERVDFAKAEPAAAPEEELAAARHSVTEKLAPTPVEVDELIRQCQLTAPIVLTVLLELELAGRLERHPGGRVSIL
ncbi:MAG: DNA-processing protein DprA [Alphaproteobacteria bacterium]